LSKTAAPPLSDGEACVPISVAEQVEFCHARGWTDGLPVVPATRELVDRMLEAGGYRPEDVIADMPSRKVAVTAEKVAINAVMAGCRPEYLPVVAAAVKGLATPAFGLHHVASALSGPTIVVVVNGPIATQLKINATSNVFGGGERANATIGRALHLVLLNCLRYRPGVSDRATFGTPGKVTCCIAENEEDHPWEPWHVERGCRPDESTVTLVAASTMIQVWNYGNHEQLLCAVGDALSFLGSIALLGRTSGAVVFAGEHAQLLRASGWGKSGSANSSRSRRRAVSPISSARAPRRRDRARGRNRPALRDRLAAGLMLICAGSPIGALSMVLPVSARRRLRAAVP
jgi:hypothetical protein